MHMATKPSFLATAKVFSSCLKVASRPTKFLQQFSSDISLPLLQYLMMNGHRRRPLLGAALVVGASRSAARSEVEKQAAREAEARLAADARRREEEDRAMRMQRAIDESVARQYAAAAATAAGKQAQPPPYHPDAPAANCLNDVRYCRQCSNLIKLQDKFCSSCGCLQAPSGVDQRILQ